MKFTFKTVEPTGRLNFDPPYHHVKFRKIQVGSIDNSFPHKIRLMVMKKDLMEDGNPNCKWKWITLRKESKSLQEAKDFLNNNVEGILKKYSFPEK